MATAPERLITTVPTVQKRKTSSLLGGGIALRTRGRTTNDGRPT
jgi:hypothetical protein